MFGDSRQAGSGRPPAGRLASIATCGIYTGGFQLVQGAVADMLAETEAARLLANRVWLMLDRGESCAREASIAKFYATEAAVRVTSKAIQVHGAYGVSDRYPTERLFRDARMEPFSCATARALLDRVDPLMRDAAILSPR